MSPGTAAGTMTVVFARRRGTGGSDRVVAVTRRTRTGGGAGRGRQEHARRRVARADDGAVGSVQTALAPTPRGTGPEGDAEESEHEHRESDERCRGHHVQPLEGATPSI